MTIPSPGAYYKAENNTNDEIATLNGSWTGTGAYTTGKINNGFNFSGSNMIYTGGTTVSSGTNISVFAWIKTTSNNVYIASRDGYASGAAFLFSIGEGTANKLSIFNLAGDASRRSASTSVNDGNWHLVGFTFNGTKLRMYVDNNIDAEYSISGTVNTSSRPITIGGRRNSAGTPYSIYHGFIGQIDEVGFWNNTLTDGGGAVGTTVGGEIAELYNGGSGKTYPFTASSTTNFFNFI